MSDFLSNLAQRVEPINDIRPRITSRFEGDRYVADTGGMDFALGQPCEPVSAFAADGRSPIDPTSLAPIQIHAIPPLHRPILDRPPTHQTPSPAVHRRVPPETSRDDRGPIDKGPLVVSPTSTDSRRAVTTFDQRLDQLRALVADLEQQLAIRPCDPPDSIVQSETTPSSRTPPQPASERVERTLIERQVKSIVADPTKERPGVNNESDRIETPPQRLNLVPRVESAKSPIKAHVEPPSVNIESSQQPPVMVIPRIQPEPQRKQRDRVEPPRAVQVARRRVMRNVIPQLKAEKAPAQRAAEAVRSQRTVNITIGRVEVRAVRNGQAAAAGAPTRENPAVMSLDEYIARRASGRIA